MSEDKDILKNAPLLSRIEKKAIVPPPGYLSSVEGLVMARIEKETSIQKPTSNPARTYFALAAGLALIMGLFFLQKSVTQQSTSDQSLSQVLVSMEVKEIDEFLDLDDDLVQEVYLEIINTEPTPEIEFLIDDDVWSDELIIEYL